MKKIILILIAVLCFVEINAQNLKQAESMLKQSAQGIEFIENKGQIADQNGRVNNEILFVAEVPYGKIAVGKDGISCSFVKIDEKYINQIKEKENNKYSFSDKSEQNDELVTPLPTEIYRVDMRLLNSNKNPKVEVFEKLEDFNNYYLAHCPDGITNVRKYKTIKLKDVYPNIDLVIYSNSEGNIQYDFAVKPGANPEQINFKYEGATNIKISPDGCLICQTPFGNIEQKAPVAYQLNSLAGYLNSNNKPEIMSIMSKSLPVDDIDANSALNSAAGKELTTGFKLNSDNSISFEIGEYDKSKVLIIDPPTRLWGTYYGGTGIDAGYGCAVDGYGNVYLGGVTNSPNAIVTSGSHQTTIGGNYDAFLVKFNSDGVRQWGTYYGGSGNDYGYAVKLMGNNYVFLCGATESSNAISTTGAHQEVIGSTSASDAFLAKFYTSGGTRVWGTYYGGTGIDEAYGLDVDSYGYVYIGGRTTSTTSIATANTHQGTLSGSYDAFIAKFNGGGVRQWGTYYGGTNDDYGYGVAVDGTSYVYLCGGSMSTSGIASTGAHQTSLNNNFDGFIAKFYATNAVRQWGTYYGGEAYDIGAGCDVDGNSNVYLCGHSFSNNAIATAGSHQAVKNGDYYNADGFLVKFNGSGVRQWGTYYGGDNGDGAKAVVVKSSDCLYLTGLARSDSYIATADAYQATRGSSDDNPDAFLAKFYLTGVRDWGTYYGGAGEDWGLGVACDDAGSIYMCGYAFSSTVFASAGAHQTSIGGDKDAFQVKFSEYNFTISTGRITGSPFCTGSIIYVNYTAEGTYNTGNVFTAQLSNSSGSFTSPVIIGTYTSTSLTGAITCTLPMNISGTGLRIRVVSSSPGVTGTDNGSDLVISDWSYTYQYTGSNYDFLNVHFIDVNTGWACGYGGSLFKTTSSGATWTALSPGTTNELRNVTFVNSNTGWIVGNSGTIMKSTDGGTNWNSQSSGTTNNLLNAYFLNSNTGWVVGSSGLILSTTNGGTNWNSQVSGISASLYDVQFINSTTGWAVGYNGVIIKTTNGGYTWTAQTSGTTDYLINTHFIDGNTGWIVGNAGIILKTTNGGTNWNSIITSITTHIYNVFFTSANNGWLVTVYGEIYYTTDGGTNWNCIRPSVSEWLFGLYFPDANTGWAVGSPGTIIKITNCNPVPINSITTERVSASPYCRGNGMIVSYTATGTFNTGNVFTAQLSDASGGYSTVIGSYTSTSLSGAITCTIPTTVNVGTAYRVRVVSSNPNVIGTDNGSNIVIQDCDQDCDPFTNGQPADYVIGQPDFITNTGNTTVDGLRLSTTSTMPGNNIAVDYIHNKLYLADAFNNRVLRYSLPLTSNQPDAELVLGQADFISGSENRGGSIQANTMHHPAGVTINQSDGTIFVTDVTNNRVLKFTNAHTITSNGVNADRVLGQPDFTSGTASTTQSIVHTPVGIYYDNNSGILWVSEFGNNRVIKFNNAMTKANGANADGVLGQATYTINTSGTTQNTFYWPRGVTIIGNSLFVSDAGNNRILRFDNAASKANGANADGLLGQTSYTISTSNLSQNGFFSNCSITHDLNGRLYVADMGNNRVMIFNNAVSLANSANADYVIGQTNFVTQTSGLSDNKFHWPLGIAVDITNDIIFVSDGYNNRVLQFSLNECYSITTGYVSSPLCFGATIYVPYTATGQYNSGNVFYAVLSSANGSFANPMVIGAYTTTNLIGTITCIIPSGISWGSGYRIRVVSSSPTAVGSDNGRNLTIDECNSISVNSYGPFCIGEYMNVRIVLNGNFDANTQFYVLLHPVPTAPDIFLGTAHISQFTGTSPNLEGSFYFNIPSTLTTGLYQIMVYYNQMYTLSDLFLLSNCTVVRTGLVEGSPFCKGEAISVPYTASGTFNTGNVFSAYIYQYGAAYTLIGTYTSTNLTGTVSSVIPLSQSSETDYCIYVVSSNPTPNLSIYNCRYIVQDCQTTENKPLSLTVAYHGLWSNATYIHQLGLVSVELRSGGTLYTSTLVSRKLAFIQTNGSVLVDFSEVPDGNYWVVVRATGYLPVAIPNQMSLSSSGIIWDFTTGSAQSAGAENALIQPNNTGKWLIRAGDFNNTRSVTASDANIFLLNNGRNVSSSIPAP